MTSILHSDTSWTFLKLNTLAGLVTNVGHSDVIATQQVTPFYDITMQICSGGVKPTLK